MCDARRGTGTPPQLAHAGRDPRADRAGACPPHGHRDLPVPASMGCIRGQMGCTASMGCMRGQVGLTGRPNGCMSGHVGCEWWGACIHRPGACEDLCKLPLLMPCGSLCKCEPSQACTVYLIVAVAAAGHHALPRKMCKTVRAGSRKCHPQATQAQAAQPMSIRTHLLFAHDICRGVATASPIRLHTTNGQR